MVEKRYPSTILATVCLPWKEDYTLDEMVFRNEIQGLIKRGINHIYVFGTAGEGYALTDAQFIDVVDVFTDEMSGDDLYPMVGLISLSFSSMLERLKIAYDFGVRDYQFALPSWGALSDEELTSFVHKLCDPYPDCRFLNYNIGRQKRILSVAEFKKLAQEIPNLAGTKFPTTDIRTIIDMADEDCPLQFFLTEQGFGYASLIGEFGFLISVASTNIKRAWEYFNAAKDKDYEKVFAMQQELRHMTASLMEAVGPPKIDGAYDKLFCKILDEEFPLRLLPPYIGNDEKCFNTYFNFLKEKFPQWVE